MIVAISLPAIIVATLSIYVAFSYLMIFINRGAMLGYLYFGLTSLAAGLYALFSAGLYNTSNSLDGVVWQQAQFVAMGLFWASFLLFAQFYTRQLSKLWVRVLIAITSFLVFAQLLNPAELGWKIGQSQITRFVFLGRTTVTIFETMPGPLILLIAGVGIAIGGYINYGAIQFYRKGFKREALPLLATTVLLQAAILNDFLVALGVVHFFYVIEYVYFGSFLIMSHTDLTNLFGSVRLSVQLRESNQVVTEMKALLEEQVEHRTQEIVKQKLYFESLIQNLPVAIASLDLNYRVSALNPAFEQLFGFTSTELTGQRLDDYIVPQEFQEQLRERNRQTHPGNTQHFSGIRERKDGVRIEVDLRVVSVQVDHEYAGSLVIFEDQTERNHAMQVLLESETRYRSLFEDAPISLWEEDFSQVKEFLQSLAQQNIRDLETYFDANPQAVQHCAALVKIVSVNQATLDIFKAADMSELLTGLDVILSEESYPVFMQEILVLAAGQNTFTTEIVQRRLTGEIIHAALRLVIAPGYEEKWDKVFVSLTDITERRRFEKHLEYLSTHDPLTNLPNRSLFLDRLEHAILLANRTQGKLAVFYLDLNKFKPINDHYGHRTGDLMLETIAQRMQIAVREGDTVARLGGDEFAIIIENLPKVQTALEIAEKIETAIRAPIEHGGHQLRVTASIGISVYPNCSYEASSLIAQADKAMYAAKNSAQRVVLCREQPEQLQKGRLT